MPKKEENKKTESNAKVFGYVVGRRAEDQEHPDKNDKN